MYFVRILSIKGLKNTFKQKTPEVKLHIDNIHRYPLKKCFGNEEIASKWFDLWLPTLVDAALVNLH